VIVFALPGAYTPTCSTPTCRGYNELAPVFSKLGVDEIVCLSVDDAFVMSEWQKDQNAPNITFIPTATAEFSRKMGLLVDKTALGFATAPGAIRCCARRRDREAVHRAAEGRRPVRGLDADTMLAYLAPREKAPEPAVVFAREGCPHCARAKAVLDANGVVYEQVTLGKGVTFSTVRAVSGKGTFPQVFIGGKLIGGADDVEAYFGVAKKAA
jgi:glutaredoxin-like protein